MFSAILKSTSCMFSVAPVASEQAQGKPVDKRADIWAFGAVLYEMLTGRRMFQGETVSDTLAAVLTKEPEWERVPTQVRRLLRRCLEKDPQKRLRDISGVGLLLEETPQAAGPRHSRVAVGGGGAGGRRAAGRWAGSLGAPRGQWIAR